MQKAQAQVQLRKRLDDSKQQRMRVARHFQDGEFAELAPSEKTIQRLRSKGEVQAATQLARAVSRAAAESRLESGGTATNAEANRIIHESLIGVNDLLSVQFLHQGSNTAYAVGRIVTLPHRGANGTGFLISPRLMMTNHHVIRSPVDAKENLVEFEYGDSPDGQPISFQFKPEEFFVTSPIDELDCTVVALEAMNRDGVSLSRFGAVSIADDENAVQVGERFNIIHHPAGGLKQVSIRDNFVAGEWPESDPRYWLYASDTERGSSGSPVFDENWKVVALHHAGVAVDDPDEVAVYRQILQSLGVAGVGEASTVELNEGIRIEKIVTWLRQEARSLLPQERVLYDEISPAVMVARPQSPESGSQFSGLSGGRVDSASPVTFNFYFAGSDDTHRPLAPTPVPEDQRRTLELFKNQLNSQKSVFKALAVLQREREEEYLPDDATIDTRQSTYYGSLRTKIENNSISASDLYEELHTLLSTTLSLADKFPESLRELESVVGSSRTAESVRTLENRTQYARARAHLYTKADLQPHRMLQCPYTKTIIAPEQLMLKDLIAELDMEHLLPDRFTGSSRFLNCEHIVPKSWFDDDHPDGISDLHHLIAADGGSNQYRSDFAFRELGAFGEDGPNDRPVYIGPAGRKLHSNDTFEPANGKHILARATLYFLICYKGAISEQKYDAAAIETLKKWSKETPPGDYEKHRNESIFGVQGNRNPLIDFPFLVDTIDFTRGLSS